jgi:pyruvate dehydrogenase E2 component (dihydrolipoamide acetyltransferase)
VDEGEDISAFADFTAADVGGDSKPAPPPKDEESKSSEPQGQYGKPTANSNTEQPQEMEGKLRTSLVLEDERFMASPLAKAIALEKGIALKNVKGTGEGGRITKADVERHQPSLGSASAGAASSVDFPLTAMRKTIASRLTESKNTNPHYYVQSSLSVGKLLKVRQVLNASANGEYKISVNDFFVKAVASALLKVPQVNSSYREAEGVIKQFNTADISVAVATPVGLMTPIIQAAHAKGLATISKDIKTLAVKARDGKLKPEEYQGGTFTISNMGMNPAVERFTAIINPPQAGILAIGAVKKVAVQGKDGGVEWDDQIVVSGSFDHR